MTADITSRVRAIRAHATDQRAAIADDPSADMFVPLWRSIVDACDVLDPVTVVTR